MALLGIYAALLTMKMAGTENTSKIRISIWSAFSVVFFLQLILGISGLESFLMTGKLHVPVPAVVIAGPIFRGERFFMPILFLSTIVLVGPAWCSHLCYIGAWDGAAASAAAHVRDSQKKLSDAWKVLRLCLFVLTPVAAIVLRVTGVDGVTAGYIAIGFGLIGIGIMIGVSTRKKLMVHCTSFCPLGLVSNILGKISPFRIKIGDSCTECGRCTAACRYNALKMENIKNRKPAITCTLCGDCLHACRESVLGYRYLRLSPGVSRLVFLCLIVSLHAVFLGVARI